MTKFVVILGLLMAGHCFAMSNTKSNIIKKLQLKRGEINTSIINANKSIFRIMNKVRGSTSFVKGDLSQTLNEELISTVKYKNFNTVKVKVINLLLLQIENSYHEVNLKSYLTLTLFNLAERETKLTSFDVSLWLALKNLAVSVKNKPEKNDNVFSYFLQQLEQPTIISPKFNLTDQVILDYSNGNSFVSAKYTPNQNLGSNEELLNQLDLKENQKKLLRAPRLLSPTIKK